MFRDFVPPCLLYISGQEGISDQQMIPQMLSSGLLWNQGGEMLLSYDCFMQMFQWIFSHTPKARSLVRWASSESHSHKGNASEYALEFLTIVTGSEWKEAALKANFCQSLNQEGLTELVPLDSLIDLAICMDRLICNHRVHKVTVL